MRKVVKQFQDHTADSIKHLNHICYCCSCFVNLLQLKYILERDPIILTIFNIDILYYNDLYCYGHNFELFDFYYDC